MSEQERSGGMGTERRRDEQAEWFVTKERAAKRARNGSASMGTERRRDEQAEWFVTKERAAKRGRNGARPWPS